MIDAGLERAIALYVPMVATLVAAALRRQSPRQFPAILLAVLWVLPSLVILQVLNLHAHWWSYAAGPFQLRGIPVELLLGWTVLWSVLPQLALPTLGIVRTAAALLVFDCVLMPLCAPAVRLQANWMVGEGAALIFVLLPALSLAQWTRHSLHVRRRALMQAVLAGLFFLFLLPELTFALRPGYDRFSLMTLPPWLRSLGLQLTVLVALPGIAAVLEFADRGHGTPIPYDPPVRLVTSGMYRYVANPMQLCCTLLLLLWALLLRNPWLLALPFMTVVYSAGLANWDEGTDLHRRFGTPWSHYRSSVRNWRPNLRPYCRAPLPVVYFARQCGPCIQVRRWVERRQPLGLILLDAESLPPGSIQRMRYDPCDGTAPVEGVRAMTRVLEHLHIGWALCGAAISLPGVLGLTQLCMDASGLGPRILQPDVTSCGLESRPKTS